MSELAHLEMRQCVCYGIVHTCNMHYNDMYVMPAQKYSSRMRVIMTVMLVDPFFQISITAMLSQWDRTLWHDQR